MGFEVFSKQTVASGKSPAVTIQKSGAISLNPSAYEMLKRPKAVELLWDKDLKVMGIRSTAETNPNAYHVRSQQSSAVIAGGGFMQHYGIDTAVAKRRAPEPELRNDILCIDMRQPGQTVISNRTKGAQRRAAAAETAENRLPRSPAT